MSYFCKYLSVGYVLCMFYFFIDANIGDVSGA